jgi:N-acetylglucosaminyl-diphospho-decaprenol L-rhamnosyltransferase
MHDLAIIIVSTNEAHWLNACLTSVFSHAGDIDLDVVVADNESNDGTRDVVESGFPGARVVSSRNRGFAHGNNSALVTCDARYVLFLNPDTEVLDGTFSELVAALDARPEVGVAGVKQRTPDGDLFPTIRRFPNALRAFGEALGSERLPFHAGWLGERVLDLELYEREVRCDWTSGSFMLVRREALESAGFMDERLFIYAEEPDLCLRVKRAGWDVRHLPQMTILHHADKVGINPKMEAQGAFARLQFASKNLSPPHRWLYISAMCTRHVLRLLAVRGDDELAVKRREASRRALRTIVRVDAPPFGRPPRQAVAIRDGDLRTGSPAGEVSAKT